jgi:cytochrome P450
MRRAVSGALREAGEQGREAAGAEDLLVAIAEDPRCGGACVMERCGVSPEAVLGKLREADGDGKSPVKTRKLDENLLRVLEGAAKMSGRLGDDHIGTEHAVVALADDAELPAGKMLCEMGMTVSAAEAALRQWRAAGMPRNRGGMDWANLKFPVLKPLLQILRLPLYPWRIYVRKSIGHPGFTTDPYPLYRWLREREPVRADPIAPVWILTRYEDVANLLRDNRYLKDPFITEHLPREAREQLAARMDPNRPEIETVSMLFLDPPEHTRVRSAFTRAFTPRNLVELRPRIEEIANRCLDAIGDEREIDLISALAYPLPVKVIAQMLGFPPEDYERIKRWSDIFAASLAITASRVEQAAAAIAREEIREYFDGVVRDAQKNPRDTMVSRLVAGMDQPGALNREEIFSNCVLLLGAGHETTTNLIGNGVLALMQNRDQWDLLVRRPELVESAVEEMLRFDSPVQWTSRLSGEEIEIDGRKIPEGTIVLGCVGAANRDPAKFVDPDRFHIEREENKHLSFGIGIHFCLGAALARMEAQIALAAIVKRFPNMRLGKGRITWMKGLTFRGVTRLPIVLR